MSREEIITNLYRIYCDVLNLQIDEEEFKNCTDLSEKYGIDSLLGLQIIVKVEQVFDILIEDDDVAIRIVSCLEEAVNLIENEKNK